MVSTTSRHDLKKKTEFPDLGEKVNMCDIFGYRIISYNAKSYNYKISYILRIIL